MLLLPVFRPVGGCGLGMPWWQVCRRPCIYFLAGHCENGNACAYCHLPHMDPRHIESCTSRLPRRARMVKVQCR